MQEEARAKYWPKDRHPTDIFHQSGLTSYVTPSYCEFSRTNVLIRSHSSGPICSPRAHKMVTKLYRWACGRRAFMCIVNAAVFPQMHPSLKPWQNMTPVSLQHCHSPHKFTHDTSHVAPVLLAVSSMLLCLPLGLNGFLSVKSYFQSPLLGGPTVPTSIRATVDHYLFGFFWIIRVALSTVMFCWLVMAFLLQQEGMVLTQKERLRAIIQNSHLGWTVHQWWRWTLNPSLLWPQVKVLRMAPDCPGPWEAGDSSLRLDSGSVDPRSVVSSHCGMGKKKDWHFLLCFIANQ